jgi:hypothetical protein
MGKAKALYDEAMSIDNPDRLREIEREFKDLIPLQLLDMDINAQFIFYDITSDLADKLVQLIDSYDD